VDFSKHNSVPSSTQLMWDLVHVHVTPFNSTQPIWGLTQRFHNPAYNKCSVLLLYNLKTCKSSLVMTMKFLLPTIQLHHFGMKSKNIFTFLVWIVKQKF
jgi:hypothetical protein